ncbi:MAG: acyl-CoA dehydrogenase family protein [Caldilineaceae bacterium]
MSIEFKRPEVIENQLRPVQVIAENVMRPESRELDDHEHARPVKFVEMIWPQMKEMERANLEAALRRVQKTASGDVVNGHQAPPAKSKRTQANHANMTLIHMIEMLSWGDAGVYLCIPASALAGAAINAVGTAEQLERFLRRFTEGRPKWGAMAMTEPQAGSDTSNIQTTAVFDAATNEWVLNGQKIFVPAGS